MVLEAVVFPWAFFDHRECNDNYAMGGGLWSFGNDAVEDMEVVSQCEIGRAGGDGSAEPSCSSMLQDLKEFHANEFPKTSGSEAAGRRKRRRAVRCKNKDEVESQRMTHIAVERNRRKLMNEYLATLQTLMPPSYVQRIDQASIVGGAINYVKNLEQLVQSLVAKKRIKKGPDEDGLPSPFSEFFAFPQYSCCSTTQSATADVEVTVAESHANLKLLLMRQPRQLLKLVEGLQGLRLTTQHLNVTTVEQMIFYSFTLKVEDDCKFSLADEIASEVYRMVGRIQVDVGVI